MSSTDRTTPDRTTDAEPTEAEPADAAVGSPAEPRGGRGGRAGAHRALALMLLCCVLGAAMLLVSGGQTWVNGHVTAQGSAHDLSVDGSAVSGLPAAMGLVGLAATVAVFALRRQARATLGVLVTLAGAAAAGVSVAAVFSGYGDGALDDRAAVVSGLAHVSSTGAQHTVWPWISLVSGLLVAAAGLLTIVRGSAWPGMSSRYDAPVRPVARPRRAETPADMWKALDRGEDPTAVGQADAGN